MLSSKENMLKLTNRTITILINKKTKYKLSYLFKIILQPLSTKSDWTLTCIVSRTTIWKHKFNNNKSIGF